MKYLLILLAVIVTACDPLYTEQQIEASYTACTEFRAADSCRLYIRQTDKSVSQLRRMKSVEINGLTEKRAAVFRTLQTEIAAHQRAMEDYAK